MASGVLSILGGLGLFLLGMSVMTDGLKNLAGRLLRAALSRFTSSPFKGAVTGTVTTALVQSSSATTVMAVGFVGAGLLTFPQALGVIFGANIGTTLTGWLVALLGFKLSLGQLVLPLVFAGALMRLFGSRTIGSWGMAIAGFGLVFIGISELQQGMDVFKDDVTPESFPPNTWVGRFLLVLIGILITLVTQSSSAGVATAITAVHVGNISLAQAAAMVIGMDVGTTATAAIAVIGGSTEARRTGLAHVIYNLMTGIAAFLVLPLYILACEQVAGSSDNVNAEIALVLFHTTFNILGVIAILPLTFQFAALIKWMVPSSGNPLVRRLDQSLLKNPEIAVENVRATLLEIVDQVLEITRKLVAGRVSLSKVQPRLDTIIEAIQETRTFMQLVNVSRLDEMSRATGASSLHVLDHLSRLVSRCQNESMLEKSNDIAALDSLREKFDRYLAADPDRNASLCNRQQEWVDFWNEVELRSTRYRREIMTQTASGKLSINESLERLDAFRWFRRIVHHVWRIVVHISQEDVRAISEEIEPETDL